MKRLRLAQTMMIATIILIAAFQCYWIVRLYEEEWQALKKETDVLFRETVYKLQVARFSKDTLMFRRINGDNLFNVDAVNVLRRQRNDTGKMKVSGKATMVISMPGEEGGVTEMNTRAFRIATETTTVRSSGKSTEEKPLEHPAIKIFTKALSDSLPVANIDSAYKKELYKAGIRVPFSLQVNVGKKKAELMPKATELKTIPASVGIANPYCYQASFANPFSFIVNKIKPQIILSVLLLAFTIFSFVQFLCSQTLIA